MLPLPAHGVIGKPRVTCAWVLLVSCWLVLSTMTRVLEWEERVLEWEEPGVPLIPPPPPPFFFSQGRRMGGVHVG